MVPEIMFEILSSLSNSGPLLGLAKYRAALHNADNKYRRLSVSRSVFRNNLQRNVCKHTK